jgi:hypothetical protein
MAIQDFTAGQVLTAAQMDALQANDYNQTVSTKTDNYVLTAADKGTRVVMNSATAKTITVNSGIFAAGDTLFLQNINTGTATVTAGTCTVTTAGSLALAQWGGGTLYFTSASAAIFFSGSGITYGTATGGIGSPTSVTIGGVAYQYLQFNATGNLVVTKAGLLDFWFWGGGGGGGRGDATGYGGGGGGAGGWINTTLYCSASTFAVTIGAGGAGSTTNGSPGGKGSTTGLAVSTAGVMSFQLGGMGGASTGDVNTNLIAYPGTCGGGGGLTSTAGVGFFNAITQIMGYNGGAGFTGTTGTTAGGGGGGTTAVGANGASTVGGNGGAGLDVASFIGGSALNKGGGGGGGAANLGGTGGSSVGGNGGLNGAGSAAAANTGSGGGGAFGATNGGAGGSGIMYVRWKV